MAPEGALNDYVVMPIVDGAEPAERMHEAAAAIRGPEVTRFRALELGIRLAFGLAERSGDVAQRSRPPTRSYRCPPPIFGHSRANRGWSSTYAHSRTTHDVKTVRLANKESDGSF